MDVESFEDAARTVRRVRDLAAYRAAIELYTGDVLPQDRYERWADERREGARVTHQALLVELARLYEEGEDFVPAIEALRSEFAHWIAQQAALQAVPVAYLRVAPLQAVPTAVTEGRTSSKRG